MKPVLIASLLLIGNLWLGHNVVMAQQRDIPLESSLVFDQAAFDGRFAVMALPEDDYNYYVTDLTRLPERFERVYFLNLAYGDNRLVNIDPDISKSQLWFKAHYTFQEKEMTCLLDDFMKESLKANETWTASQKQEWLAKFDKYNTRKSDEK